MRLTKSKMPLTTHKIELPNEVILGDASAMLAKGKDVTISTKGNSMLPFIRGGVDSVELRKIPAIHRGDIVLAQIAPGHYVLHRVFREPEICPDGRLAPETRITLMGDGNVRGTEICRACDICGTCNLWQRSGVGYCPSEDTCFLSTDILSLKKSVYKNKQNRHFALIYTN